MSAQWEEGLLDKTKNMTTPKHCNFQMYALFGMVIIAILQALVKMITGYLLPAKNCTD